MANVTMKLMGEDSDQQCTRIACVFPADEQ
jgi:hypothetical protein